VRVMASQSPQVYPSTVFRVGKLKCEMRFADGALHAEWSPRMPGRLTKREFARLSRRPRRLYRRGSQVARAARLAGGGAVI
jgi:hypothetical protein